MDARVDRCQNQVGSNKTLTNPRFVELENENYILNDRVTALEQLLRLKDEQLSSVKQPGDEEDSDRKFKKLTQRIQAMKVEKKRD